MTSRNYIDICVERDSEFCATFDANVTVCVEQGLRGLPGIGTVEELTAMLNGFPEYQSNEAAKAAYEIIYGVGNAIGKMYWAAQGNTEVSEGTFMRVV